MPRCTSSIEIDRVGVVIIYCLKAAGHDGDHRGTGAQWNQHRNEVPVTEPVPEPIPELQSRRPIPDRAWDDAADILRQRAAFLETTDLEHYPRAASRNELSERTGYKRSSRDAYVQRLRARQLVITGSDGVSASGALFE